jgi:rhodanese-related sulfurtransferase
MAEAESDAKQVDREQASEMLEQGAQLLDVRADHEWQAGRIEGAKHVPLADLPERIEELDRERPVVGYCRGGTRSSMAAEALTDGGFEAVKMSGGIVGWDEDGKSLEPEGGYVADSGEAAAVLQARKKAQGAPSE